MILIFWEHVRIAFEVLAELLLLILEILRHGVVHIFEERLHVREASGRRIFQILDHVFFDLGDAFINGRNEVLVDVRPFFQQVFWD